MKRQQDAFGQALWDFYQGEDVREMIERDDGFISIGRSDLSGYFSSYAKWRPGLKKAIGYAKGRVLDIGCGAGRVALHLQKRGLDVLGIDVSPLAVKVCRARGVKRVRLMSITDLRPGMGPFDTIVMFGNNFGLVANFNRARRLLKRFHRMTSPQALIIAQTLDPYKTDCREHLNYHKRNRTRGRMGGQIRMRSRHKTLIGPWFDYLFVSRAEIKEILVGTGWRVRRFIPVSGPNYVAIIEKE